MVTLIFKKSKIENSPYTVFPQTNLEQVDSSHKVTKCKYCYPNIYECEYTPSVVREGGIIPILIETWPVTFKFTVIIVSLIINWNV